MRDGLVETKLGQYIHINTGKLDVNAASEFGKYPFFTCSRETYRIDEAAFEGESVLVAGNGDLNVKYYDGKFNAYQRTYVLNSIDRSILDNQFLFLYMQSYIEYLRSETRGTVIQYLKKGQFTDAKIKLPPLPEQRRIVDLISSVDSYIEALQQQLDSAKRSRNAVLHELLTAGGDDWVETTIGEVVSVVNGGTPSTKSEDYWGGSIVWITTTELTAFDGKRVNSSKRTITVDGLRNGPARLVRAGTTLVGTTATIGTCALADCELTFNQQISGLIPLDKDLDDSYLFYWIQHIKSILEGLSAGTSFKRISTSVLKTVSINFPPIGEQKRIAAVISEMDEFIESIQRTSIEAKNLRSGLLSDLLSGTHEIPVTYDKAMGPA